MSLSNSFQFEYLAPLWYPDQIENVISFLASQVAETYYGCGRNSMDHFIQSDRLRRSQPKHSSLVHHNSSRCQACKDGWCTASGYFVWLSMHLCNISFNYPLFNFIFVFWNFDFVIRCWVPLRSISCRSCGFYGAYVFRFLDCSGSGGPLYICS